MKNKLIFLLVFFSISNNILAQEYIIRVEKSNRVGYIHINNNNEKHIMAGYYNCWDFSKYGSGIILKNEDLYHSIIDKKGNKINTEVPFKPFINEWGNNGFSDGMIRTKKNGKVGALNYKGKLTVPIIYDELSEFNDKYAIGIINKSFFIIKNNRQRIAIKFKKINTINHFSEGLASIKIGKYYGYIDTLGHMVIDPKFKSVGYFNNDLAWAKDFNGLLGYIDKLGNWVIDPKFHAGKNYDKQSDLARVKTKKGWGYVNSKNQYNDLGITKLFYSFNEGLAIKRLKDKLGYIKNTGKWCIEPIFDVAHSFKNGFARVRINNKWGIIDKNGKWLLEPRYDSVGDVVIILE